MATANTNTPFGFKWHGLYGDAAQPTGGLIQMKIVSTDTSVYGEGDPVMFQSTGYVTAFTKTTAVSQLAGIFKACEYYNSNIGRRVWSNYWPGSGATGDIQVFVTPCAGSIAPRFLVQASGSAITFGSVWNNVDIASGSSTAGTATGGYYKSAAKLDTTITTTSTLPWRIVGLWSDIGAPGSVGTDNTSSYNWVLVEANVSQATGI
jgi:hypothetical protein